MPGSTENDTPSSGDGPPVCVWMEVGDELPEGDILVWSAGKAVVGSLLLHRKADGAETRSFIDVLGNEILPWPTYWMLIPSPPGD
jgi:hypothetical protein